jgi:N-methylhydantoinase A
MTDWRLAIDIGGTFTDVVLLEATTGTVVVEKTLTTPSNLLIGFQRGVEAALAKAGIRPRDIRAPIVHATTLITNALIEHKVPPTALVTTSGFGSVLDIRDEHRYDMYDLQIEFPPPPVPRADTFELDERTLADGTVVRTPQAADLDALADSLASSPARAVAVCFLHSYANGTNERLVRDALEARLSVPVCISSEVAPQIREYPRTVTTVCNASTMPIIGPYLEALESWLHEQEFGGSLMMMLSNGGVASSTVAAHTPIRLVESGPAAGALAGAWVARSMRAERLLCFDMGGTTAKACLIEDHEPAMTMDFEVARMYRFKKGSGLPVTLPSVDLVEIGAGGGSLARVDDLGLLKVGPESAGADPGPASYGQGGTGAAVTDADLMLGFLDAGFFLGGEMTLEVPAAEQALAKVAAAIGASSLDTAAGVHDVVNQNMAAAARMHAVERGIDLRGVTLLAFGGAGPVHACGVAELLDSPRVVFPARASVLSAFGTLVTPVRIDLARTMIRPLLDVDPSERDRLLVDLCEEGARALREAGVADSDVRFRFGVDARYRGQAHEITVWVGDGDRWPASPTETLALFSRDYERIYGMSIPEVPVEAVTWRVAVWTPAPAIAIPAMPRRDGTPAPSASRRPVWFGREGDATSTPVFERATLRVGDHVDGPAIVQERETTIVLRPGWHAEVIDDGSVVATRSVDD